MGDYATNPHAKLVALLTTLVKAVEADTAVVQDVFEPVLYAKGHQLVMPGKTARFMYYINTGYIRTFYLDDLAEVTTNINCPLGFITAFDSYVTQQPASEYLECITDCQLLRISKQALDNLFRKSPVWAEAGRLINEQVIVYNAQRTRDMVTVSAEQRYLNLMEEHPDFFQHIPLQYLASFIGVKPESLSRIRKRLSFPNPG
ncbi:Crp/Fnr family transcriptional regulator [Deminuibacter soli]|nr:Crp/Fnr family transcriptional regulator [Deminuibacter soli]